MGAPTSPNGASRPLDPFVVFAEASSDGVLVLDTERRVTYLNSVAAARLGGRPKELMGGAFVYPFTLDGTEQVTLGPDEAHAVPVELAAREIAWEGRPAVLVVLRDRTSREEAQQLGRRMERRLRGAHRREAIGSLAAGLAHDFNNFLTVSLGRSELLLRRLGDDEDLARHVRLLHMGAKHHSVLTRQFLGMVGRESGPPEDLDTDGTLGALAPVLRAALGDAVEVDVDADPSVGDVHVAVGRIEQILVNLALNARDAMPAGGTLTIRAAAEQVSGTSDAVPHALAPGRYVRFEVRDTGRGMPAHVVQRAFEPFFSTKAPREGGGLGLAVVRGLVTESGGGVWIESAPDAGTTVTFLLPGADEKAKTQGPARRIEAPASRGVVLLVEDEPDVRVLVREILETCAYQVLEAEDGREAERLVATHAGPLEMVLTDVVMPRKNGADLARALRDTNPGLPVLYMSGYTKRDIYRRGLIPDGAPYIQKPFPPTELLDAVERITT